MGNVVIIDLANTEKSPVEIMAHDSAISCMTLSHDGAKLATSSIKVSCNKLKKNLNIKIKF